MLRREQVAQHAVGVPFPYAGVGRVRRIRVREVPAGGQLPHRVERYGTEIEDAPTRGRDQMEAPEGDVPSSRIHRGAAVDSGRWDIAFRRFHLITAPGGGILDLGPVPFDSVRELPAGGYLANANASDTTNPGVGKWYAYSMLSHLLTSKHHVYGVRTAGGSYAKLELLAYYCKDVGTACVTFRYAYQGGGTRRVAPAAR